MQEEFKNEKDEKQEDIKNENKKKNKNKKSKNKIVLVTILTILVIVAGVSFAIYSKNKSEDKNVAYTQLIKDIDEGKVGKIKMTVNSTSIVVTYKDSEGNVPDEEQNIQ